MPCSPCEEAAKLRQQQIPVSRGAVQYFPGLDYVDNALLMAYSEVAPEERENINLMRDLVHRMQKNSPRPKDPQWQALFMILQEKILPYIGCPYCRQATYYHLEIGAWVHMYFEQGKYWTGLKLSVKSDVLKYYWMMKAGYYRLLKPGIRRHLKW